MCKIPIIGWIANAAARFAGVYGGVTQQAREQGCSRQTVYNHAAAVLQAVRLRHPGQASDRRLVLENQELRRENSQLWDWLDQSIELSPAKQQEFGIRAAAMGLSLNQIVELLTLLLGVKAAPGRSTVHRWVQAAALMAGKVLQRLDQQSRGHVTTACLDEIFFHGHPVFVGVEPQSMTLILAQKGDRLDRATWLKRLVGWNALRYVVCDAGTVLQSALAALSARCQATGAQLQVSLDVFHTTKEAQRVLKVLWNRVKKDWKAGVKADLRVARFKRKGEYAYRAAGAAASAWTKVAHSLERYDSANAGWQKAKQALDLVRPDGRLNDRAWAEARVNEALPALAGKAWTTLRHLLQAHQAFTFLDQLQTRLAQLPIKQELRDALVRLWWLRRSRDDDPGHQAKAILVQQVICWKLEPEWLTWYQTITGLLHTAVRASSVVESVNSVLRMHQSRHRTLNQGLLNLKRLYWNTRRFRKGRRRGKCPYQLLGLKLPSYDFWSILQDEMTHAPTPGDPLPTSRAPPC
jgi:hypothetical protein